MDKVTELKSKISDLNIRAQQLKDRAAEEGRSLTAVEKELLGETSVMVAELENDLRRQPAHGPLTLSMGNRVAVDTDGNKFPVLLNSQRMTELHRGDSADWSLGDFVKASMGLEVRNASVERGTATVPSFVSSRVIDLMRAQMRVVQAGALTLPVSGPTTLARISGDPTVIAHVEGQEDISASVPTIAPVTIDPVTLVSVIPLTLELVQDSPNLDSVLETTLAGAFASKVDSMAIALLLASTALNESAASHATATWAGTLLALAAALAEDMDIPQALIANEGDFVARAGQLASTAGSWLGAPPVLANMLDLPTTAMTVGKAVFGDFTRGIGIAVRQQLRTELIRWKYPTTGSHALVAYARIQPYILQGGALFRQIAVVG